MDDSFQNEIQSAIRRKYQRVAHAAAGSFRYPTGREGLKYLGYDPAFFAGLPEAAVESFCGVGNPFSAGEINDGESVLDVGCGAGLDVIYAARLVGPDGRVEGIDLTPEMVAKARKNLKSLQLSNARVQEGKAEAILFDDATFDVVISSGVLNLSLQKEQSLAEIHRVLMPGGRLQFADIILEEDCSGRPLCSAEDWSH